MPKTTAPPRPTPRRTTMTPQEVIARLNNYHRTVVFPNMFDRLQFDMIAEVEYNFVVRRSAFA